MANPTRGEVRIDVNGKPYTLKLTMNAGAVLQARTKRTVGELMAAASALDFAAIRSVVWMLLQKHHADEFKTEEQAGDFIDDAGGVPGISDAISAVVMVNQPPDTGEAADATHPQTAQAGTTGASASRPVGLA